MDELRTRMRKTLAAALRNPSHGTSPARIIEDAVKGEMGALLLADYSLSRGALFVLEAVHEASVEAHLDPTEAMCAALRGIADLRRVVQPVRLDEIRIEVAARYMGAGEVFSEYLRAPVLL